MGGGVLAAIAEEQEHPAEARALTAPHARHAGGDRMVRRRATSLRGTEPKPGRQGGARDGAAPATTPSHPFRQVVHWQLKDLGMLLGTDQLVFSSPEHPAMSLQVRPRSPSP